MSGRYAIARAPRYLLSHAKIPRSLLAVEIGEIDREGFAKVDLLVEDGSIGAIAPAGAGRAPGRRTSRVCRSPTGSSSRCSSTPTPISTRAISGRAPPIRTALSPPPSTPLPQTARPTGARATSPPAWNSHCAAPMRTGPAPCAPISTASARRRRSAGPSSPRFASDGAAASSCKPRLYSGSTSLSMKRTCARSSAMSTPMARASSGAVTLMVPELREALEVAVRACGAQRLRPRFPCRRDCRSDRRLPRRHRRSRAAAALCRPRPRRPLLLADPPG